MNIKDQSIKSVRNQSIAIYQSTKYSEALIKAYNKQYKWSKQKTILEAMYQSKWNSSNSEVLTSSEASEIKN